jgi:hypothetical protein
MSILAKCDYRERGANEKTEKQENVFAADLGRESATRHGVVSSKPAQIAERAALRWFVYVRRTVCELLLARSGGGSNVLRG